ncbi:MAG: ribonuclease Y [Candidatus Eremiobacteraeota bacterium]|nr:ribonuclease Y [Candidatus Eremiobacteraeota bacterium]
MTIGIPIIIISAIVGMIMGAVVCYFTQRHFEQKKIGEAKETAGKIIEDAKKEANDIKRTMVLEAKEENLKLKSELEKDREDRRSELQRFERRLMSREENLEKKSDNLDRREKGIKHKENETRKIREQALEIKGKQQQEIERIARLTKEEARAQLFADLERELQMELALRVKQNEERVKEESNRIAKMIITTAIQKWAADQVVESTVSVVSLPNDEMKGRIIGREGRNIRMLESLTGIDLIIDDTPEAVILSGFDPIRREVARMALEKLIIDGRIHPARIEEMVEKAQKEMEEKIREEGERATFEVGITGIHPEIVRVLGKLRYRTSYGQNVLQHSIEVAFLAGTIASELGIDPRIAKRAGLLHDIGKSLDSDIEGPHALIGAKYAVKYNETPEVVHAIAAHHEDEEQRTIEAILVQAADAISAARPGARRETLETYIKRLEKLEHVANSFEGVEKSYAIQAGREVRIMVRPDQIDDTKTARMARDIVKKIEEELEYPGQIKVTVIRETRTVEYAK